MRTALVIPLALLLASNHAFAQAPSPAAPPASAAAPATKASAEVKLGLGIDKWEVTGAADTFKVAPDTKIYAWTKVSGAKDQEITIVFAKDGKTVFQQKLPVKSSPYRCDAYHAFRAGDAGAWTAKVLGPDGAELGSASFTVEIS
jgi:hypothetical protein